jgi:phosphoserine phosphatase RsbU/P
MSEEVSPSRLDAPASQWFGLPWKQRLDEIVDMAREMSGFTEPQAMVTAYGKRMAGILQSHRRISLSCRDMIAPQVRITGSDLFANYINPWTQKSQLPIITGGLLAELIYGEKPLIINDLNIPPDDPGQAYFEGMKSICVIPLFDNGKSLNMVIFGRREKNAYSPDMLPEYVWISNLFGRATTNLVLKQELQVSNQHNERELQRVADIQRSLLPTELPSIPGLDIAAYYATSRHAGGDYYDFFELPGGQLGLLIADVSGHGTPAAVMMAVTHSIAHTHHGQPTPPSRLLEFVNRHLSSRYTQGNGTFVTAFYGIYNPADRTLTFANAGHNPPRLKRGDGGPNGIIEGRSGLPLGIDETEYYADNVQQLHPGDTLVLYTDGITEARATDGDMFETDRLDAIINASVGDSSRQVIDCTIDAVNTFTHNAPPHDDRTMLVVRFE